MNLRRSAVAALALLILGFGTLPGQAQNGPNPAAETSPITLTPGEDTIEAKLRGRRVVVYRGGQGELPADVPEAYRRGGYLHPLVTPAGHLVSGDYPTNHLHHHGLWTAWTKTEFAGRTPDFWNMGQQKGRVEFVELLGTRITPEFGEIRARHRFVDLTAASPETVLEEEWTVRVRATAPTEPYAVDLEILQRNVTGQPLRLPKYHYGGLGFRGLDAWDGPANCQFLTSEGLTNRVAGNETRGRWCWVGGAVADGVAGVTLLSHPDNFRAPEPMRLNPTEPFFCFAPQQLGDFEIPASGTHRARYRILISDGPPDSVALDHHWTEWAKGQ